MEEFHCATRVIAGPGAVEKLRELGAKRVFVVTDPFFYENGTAGRIAACTGAQQVEIFHNVKPDPTVELAAEGTARLKAFGADLIIALGGGSAMDCAKAMAWFGGENARLAAIPTTSGSGSEVTDFAILTHDHVKHPLIDGRLKPDLAILDSDLLRELPKTLVADAGFDVISHAVEAYTASGAGLFSDALARDAFRIVYEKLPDSYGGDLSARLPVHKAATMAGMAFSQAGLGLCHAMAHSLGGKFHVPHGRLNAILLPSVVSCNAQAAGRKYGELAWAVGIGSSADTVAVRNLRNGLIRLRKALNLPENLAQAGITPRDVAAATEEIVKATLADPCCKTNPVPVTEAVVTDILGEVAGFA